MMMPTASPYPAWFHFGSSSYTTAPYATSGLEGVFPPYPYYLPPSMSWAEPYALTQIHPKTSGSVVDAYWTAFQHASGSPASAAHGREAGSDNDRAPEALHW
ncbi:uncharacterized protein PG986_003110 [Apiospora aurea]|uniref:Uncharacterized protein n=1 Tax=Apiospora aurea TaxID=335848 RepID=A0ABR1QQR0_9PEZI